MKLKWLENNSEWELHVRLSSLEFIELEIAFWANQDHVLAKLTSDAVQCWWSYSGADIRELWSGVERAQVRVAGKEGAAGPGGAKEKARELREGSWKSPGN